MKSSSRIILTDCDGVLLDWTTTFNQWMSERGLQQSPDATGYYRIQDQYEVTGIEAKKYTRLFNESAAIGFLQPLRDSVYWVRRLNQEHQYRFVVITSLSTDPYARQHRINNLQRLFGDVFEDIQCLDTGSDKHKALDYYRDSGLWWIEDKPENAEVGHDRGLRSILLEHDHNLGYGRAGILRLKNWQQIYHAIVN